MIVSFIVSLHMDREWRLWTASRNYYMIAGNLLLLGHEWYVIILTADTQCVQYVGDVTSWLLLEAWHTTQKHNGNDEKRTRIKSSPTIALYRTPVPRLWCSIQLPGIQQCLISKHICCIWRSVELYIKYSFQQHGTVYSQCFTSGNGIWHSYFFIYLASYHCYDNVCMFLVISFLL